MICGEPNIWPMPTGRTKVSSRSLTLSSETATLHVETRFPAVQQLVESAFELFVGDLQVLEANSVTSAAASVGTNRGASRASSSSSAAATDPANKPKSTDCGNVDEQSQEQQQQQRQRINRNADVKHFNVKVYVTASAEVYLNLDTDESYNLTLTSEYHIRFNL